MIFSQFITMNTIKNEYLKISKMSLSVSPLTVKFKSQNNSDSCVFSYFMSILSKWEKTLIVTTLKAKRLTMNLILGSTRTKKSCAKHGLWNTPTLTYYQYDFFFFLYCEIDHSVSNNLVLLLVSINEFKWYLLFNPQK